MIDDTRPAQVADDPEPTPPAFLRDTQTGMVQSHPDMVDDLIGDGRPPTGVDQREIADLYVVIPLRQF
ncbi:hypothetical protein [uncultured Sphingomonas sp.]|uniref:hypothetical protein n=1 Tax=uncultured Sphingomonas sp. TaxID=158754 RepID=UPI0025EE5B28|nr:hypothetical protein [uncultured Sphingomonas sp.]